MERKELEKRINDAMDKQDVGIMATMEGNQPKARYMALFHNGMHIHMATSRKTHKVEELAGNPHVSVLCGYEGKWPAELLDIEGTCEVTKDESLRTRLWHDDMKRWFSGPDAPDYVVLDVTPTRIGYTDRDGELHVWER
ncbi:pyridoxamine 5'-phosphate oxidase family protein [Paenibacillus sp. IB182496]|uniref:Pyridoxamine 5'-phosphate oxidase family protein n=1 Tax=Paenibacillus sabuli TaxID=2772509 RepID=A0A927BP95_9BACL|nr:pyridoxamine 5'-phosphate oxidase family protein [Paenibacillus sabuli]MBD2844213.1 pyridoxamine 5'-phosphate oxidase family protein [Paenibacillus sabuli]